MFGSIKDYINKEFWITFVAGLAFMCAGYVSIIVLFSLQGA